MFKNYLITAFRNFRKNKIFSTINILGLSIGISAALVIYLVVHYDFSFEKFRPDRDRIYRVVSNMHFPNLDFKNRGVCGPLPGAIRANVPGIEASTAFWDKGPMQVSIPGEASKKFRGQEHIIFADEYYFRFFPYQWIAGSPERALDGPNKVVLTESRVRTYFPDIDISRSIGKVILYDDSIRAIVTGVVRDIDQQTDFIFKEFISLPTYLPTLKKEMGYDQWGSLSSSSQFFIRLRKNIDPVKVEKEIVRTRKRLAGKEYLATDNFLQPLSDLHFNPVYGNYSDRMGNKKTLYGLIAVASFLLLLGCINFINLTTAQASRRAREIGIRKTMGSSFLQLLLQFLGETFLLTVMAIGLSIVLTPWLLHIFSDFIPSDLRFNPLQQPGIIVFILCLSVVVCILAGAYPALILSRYKPVLVLKNVAYADTGRSRKAWFRKILTVSQFVIAQFLIIATLIVGKQIRYALNTDMGFRKDAILSFDAPLDFNHPDNKQFFLLAKLKAIPGIQKISLAGAPPASNGYSFSTMTFNKDGKDIETTVEIKSADTNYISLYHLRLLAGKNLQQSDTTREYVVNEAYAKFLGFRNPADIVGKFISNGDRKVPIVGLVADFHSGSVQGLIKPTVLTCRAKYQSDFNILLAPKGENTDNWKKTITQIEKSWKEVYPEQDFHYAFVDETIAKFYTEEQHLSRLLTWCTGLAVFISCLGLLGLVIYSTTQRTKEIGVRKVLGASASQIVALLSKDFVQLVMIAFVIASPLAWLAMHKWLENYAYRTSIGWWVFIWSGAGMLCVALLTLSVQTLRSAAANPVESLRSE